MLGFFDNPPPARPAEYLLPRCDECGLYKHCTSPKMKFRGRGRQKILVVGEAPGADEDRQGRPFVGKAGRKLRAHLSALGVDLDQDCITTNAAICRPRKNETPTIRQIKACRPNLNRVIRETSPEVIILLGETAVKSLLGHLFKEGPGAISRWAGWQIPSQKLNAWVCPTWHPSYLDHTENDPVLEASFRKHLYGALNLEGRPWPQGVPDYKKGVRCVFTPEEATQTLEGFVNHLRPIAFDFETDRLKPDHPDAQIVCCAVSDGETTVSFPWLGRTVTALRHLLASDVPKIGYNVKFEARWCRRQGLTVKNGFAWDGMLAAHLLDNRSDITSLEFQVFVNFGFAYKDETQGYMAGKEPGGNSVNRVKECDLQKLLLRCGLDALLEYKVAQIQMNKLGVIL